MLSKQMTSQKEYELKTWGNFGESSDGITDLRQIRDRIAMLTVPDTSVLESRLLHLCIYSKAQCPEPHSGRAQPKLGAPELPQMGNELDRPEWTAAGTLNCLAISMLPHLGQRATSLELRIKVSKVWSQGSQRYS